MEGDIPAIKWVKKLDKNKPSLASLEAKNDYLLDVLAKETDRLKFVKDSSYAPNTEKPKAQAVNVDEDDSELPF